MALPHDVITTWEAQCPNCKAPQCRIVGPLLYRRCDRCNQWFVIAHGPRENLIEIVRVLLADLTKVEKKKPGE